jgi:phage terminase small subunit
MPRQNPLTARQRRFCDLYLENPCAAEAYRKAGYKSRSAKAVDANSCRLMAKPQVQEYLNQAIAARSERTQIDADQVLRDIREVADVGMGRKEALQTVIVDGEPMQLKVKAFNGPVAVKALDMLARHLGLYNDRDEKVDVRQLILQFIQPSTTRLPGEQQEFIEGEKA